MELGIEGRCALVFGGSRGVGRAVAGALAAEGAHVAVCARKEWAARRVAAEAAAGGGVRTAGYPLDAWDEPSATALVDRVLAEFGPIDILFGIARRPKLEPGRALSWKTQLDNGFLRFKAATEALLPLMRRRRWGRVLWMIPWPVSANGVERRLWSVTGAALSAWLESTAADAAGDNVTLNVLKPASLSVPEVAGVATFLLSDRAGGLYGKTIEMGNGRW